MKSLRALACRATAAAAPVQGAILLCAAVTVLALAGCGSVQTTTNAGGTNYTPQSVADPRPPVISGFPPTAAHVGLLYDYTPAVTDELSTALTFSITNAPVWASFNSATGELKGTPGIDDVGATQDIAISAFDGVGRATVGPFKITVMLDKSAPPTAAPTISGTPPGSITAGAAYSFTPHASDPAGNPLSFLIVNRPSWASFSTSTGQFYGTPTAADVGSFENIAISVSNGVRSATLPAFAINVAAADAAPSIAGSPTTRVDVGAGYNFTPSAHDPQGHALTFSIQNPPSWASFDTTTGKLAGTPGAADVGSFPNITISVSNGTLAAALPAFTVTVSAVGTGPAISGSPATMISAGNAYSFTPSASGPGGNALAFSIQNKPTWASFNTSTGELSGTPNQSNLGSYPNILISVSDGAQSAVLPAFTLTVTALVASPTIAGTPATSANVGSAYSFTPSASDPQGHALTFSIQNQPAWLTFSIMTGRLTGTPGAANVGSFANITISVSNGTRAASLPAFTLTVTALDGFPRISGVPAAAVNAGSAYSFTPSASDPQGRALIYSIQNQPSWASFNTATGKLSGTPSAADVGSYRNITISVSNTAHSASLPAFSIAVGAVSSGTATLNWSIPTQNTNGTPLLNVAGYRIYYGVASSNLNQSVQVSNPNVTTYVLTNLAAGTWYFGIVDYTASGAQSDLSNIASKTVQ